MGHRFLARERKKWFNVIRDGKFLSRVMKILSEKTGYDHSGFGEKMESD